MTYPDRQFLKRMGEDPEAVALELSEFSASAQLLSDQREKLVDKHLLEWVCVHRGKVSASSKSLDALMREMKEQGIPANNAIVRFIDDKQKTLII